MSAYFRQPAVCGKQVVFVSEDDLWSVPLSGGKAERLTSNLSSVSMPVISPDGKWIAFVSREEGVPDIYVMPSGGGEAKRLTWLGTYCQTLCWKGEEIIFSSMHGGFNMREQYLYRIGLEGNPPQRMNFGPAQSISFGPKGVVLGRNTGDPARWKRYRGGTAGYLMLDAKGTGEFCRFLDLNSNIGSPMWIKDRIYFISDHEGIANIYSAKTNGKDIKKHSHHTDYYARNAKTDGTSIIWQAGAEIYYLDINKDKVSKVKIDYRSPRIQRSRKYVEPSKYMGTYELSPDGSSLCMDIRGKAFCFGAWEGSVQQYGVKHGVRYRHVSILPEDRGILMVSDEGDKEHFEIHPLRKDFSDAVPKQSIRVLNKHDYGRPYGYLLSPCGKFIAYSNHRNELYCLNLETEELTFIDKNEHGIIEGYAWSADSRWIAYGISNTRLTSHIKIFDTTEKVSRVVTIPVKNDMSPCFDPEGKYLYLVSERTFSPTIDTIQTNYTFLNCAKPYLIPLRKDIKSPFIPEPKAFEPKPNEDNKKSGDTPEPKAVKSIEIDFDGITDRLIEFPLKASNYTGLYAIKNRLFYVKYDVTRLFYNEEDERSFDLYYYDMEKMEEQLFQAGLTNYTFSLDNNAIAMTINKKIRIVSTKREGKSELPKETTPGRNTGWVDLNRV
ncbi:MAG TPA: peptidase, partial [Candidatus Cloacimonadota bacterium]|nr:peptidase [Candidatus Cloacimonadota bacterium]